MAPGRQNKWRFIKSFPFGYSLLCLSVSRYKLILLETEMPILSLFYGLIVRMYREVSGKHHKPHIHVEYANEAVVIALDGEILEGSIPNSKMKLVEAWMEIHHDDLEANWKLLSQGEEYFKIDPLK